MQRWKLIAWMLKHVMRISLFSMSITLKLKTCPGPLELLKIRSSVFESTLTFNVHSRMYGCNDLIGVISSVCFDGVHTSLFHIGLPIMVDVKAFTCTLGTLRILQHIYNKFIVSTEFIMKKVDIVKWK